MARFLGAVKGSRGEVTRLGTPSSGIEAHAQGWDIGARITCYVDADGNDCVRVELTRGSNRAGHNLYLGAFKLEEHGDYAGADGYGTEIIDLATEYNTITRDTAKG